MYVYYKSSIIPDVLKILPPVHEDSRGSFSEIYSKKFYDLLPEFVQDNVSCSVGGVLRGLHFQLKPFEQGKLVTCIYGEIYDVAVDLRPESPTFGKWDLFKLDSIFKEQLWIPPGCAHGFYVPEGEAIVHYKVTEPYNKEAERTLLYNDEEIGIDWELSGDVIMSEKDKNGLTFDQVNKLLILYL